MWCEFVSAGNQESRAYWCYDHETFEAGCQSVAEFNARDDVQDSTLIAYLVQEAF